jgi:hypothetical protein
MSTNYTLSIRRKIDDKEIARFLCNQLKCIFYGGFGKYINCDNDHLYNNEQFEYKDLISICDIVQEKISTEYKNIQEKKLLIALAQNKEIKEELEDEIFSIEDEVIPELFDVYYGAVSIKGSIETLVENNMKLSKEEDEDDHTMAYRYNAEDLKNEDNDYPSLWVDQVYCIIES